MRANKIAVIVLMHVGLLAWRVRAQEDSAPAGLDLCNVVWTTASDNARGSMPLGNGEVGIDLWVEKNGDLQFYISRTDALAESARLAKVGWVRVSLSPNPFAAKSPFRQELVLRDGKCVIQASQGAQRVQLTVFVDSDRPVVHVTGETTSPVEVTATIENMRPNALDFRKTINVEEAYTMRNSPIPLLESADVLPKVPGQAVAWYHRDEHAPVVPSTLELQSLKDYANLVHDPMRNLTFGGWITAEGFTSPDPRTLRSTAPVKSFALRVAVPAAQTATAQDWLELARQTAKDAQDSKAAEQVTAQWWHAFWSRSWVLIDDKPGAAKKGEASTLSRGYMLQRYMNACGGRGGLPIKFNGSIFTVDRVTASKIPYEADWRQWGDAHWWQNIRFPYHAMLACGDFEMMQPMFRMYENARPLAEVRSKLYYNAEGAFFPETMTPWGTYANGDYGWSRSGRKLGQLEVATGHMWNQGPELVSLMIDYYQYTGDRQFLDKRLLPMAESVLRYFVTRFGRDEAGRIRLTPTQAVETYQAGVTNDAPTVAGLVRITNWATALPEEVTPPRQRAFFAEAKRICPLIPTEGVQVEGKKVLKLAPAESYNPGRANVENPELYPIWPYRLYGVGLPDLELARRGFEHRANPSLVGGWGYDSDCAALLGLTQKAAPWLEALCRSSNGDYRWPATWGPNYDWIPDQTHGGNLMLTAQYMLLQSVGEKIYLLPAWPKDWDVDFKMHTTNQTVVECVYRGGRIEALRTTPPARRQDIVLPDGVSLVPVSELAPSRPYLQAITATTNKPGGER